jgi:hypothetical protein
LFRLDRTDPEDSSKPVKTETTKPKSKIAWSKSLAERVRVVETVLHSFGAPATPAELAKQFKPEILETLHPGPRSSARNQVHSMNASDAGNHGFKQVTVANWAEMDDTIQFPAPVADETWVKACLHVQLNPQVPKDIAAMFEVARGSMIYGWFFYPLITLATEQFHRILEAAARTRCAQLGLPTSRTSKAGKPIAINFSDIIQALIKAGEIKPTDLRRWEATRKLRNWSSHPERQSILSPGMALNEIDSTATLLHRLFN